MPAFLRVLKLGEIHEDLRDDLELAGMHKARNMSAFGAELGSWTLTTNAKARELAYKIIHTKHLTFTNVAILECQRERVFRAGEWTRQKECAACSNST